MEESFATVAANCCLVVTGREAEVGLMETEMDSGAAVTVMAATADFVPSATDVAVSVTLAGFGTTVGALYVTEVVAEFVSVPHAAPEHPAPESPQVTPLFEESFCTLTAKFCDCET